MKTLENDVYWNYNDLIDSMEVEVLVEVDENSYEGSSWLIIKDGERYGYLCYGWGSCSGCDALQACASIKDATDLRDELWNSVHWENSAGELLSYFVATDWSLKWEYHASEFKEFLEAAKATLYDHEMVEIGL